MSVTWQVHVAYMTEGGQEEFFDTVVETADDEPGFAAKQAFDVFEAAGHDLAMVDLLTVNR